MPSLSLLQNGISALNYSSSLHAFQGGEFSELGLPLHQWGAAHPTHSPSLKVGGKQKPNVITFWQKTKTKNFFFVFGGFYFIVLCDTSSDVHYCTEAAQFSSLFLLSYGTLQGCRDKIRIQDLPYGRQAGALMSE